MSHNSFVRQLGVWNAFQPVLHGEFAAFDLSQFKSINGDDGGTWAPAAVITIGGHGLSVVGQFSASGTANFVNIVASGGIATSGSADIESSRDVISDRDTLVNRNLSVGGTATFSGSAGFQNVVVNGVFGVSGASIFSSAVVCSDALGIAGTLTANGTTHLNGSAILAGLTTISGGAALSSTMVSTGAGRVVERVANVTTGSAISSFGPFNVDTLYVSNTADIVLTINDSGAVDGDQFHIVCQSSTNTITVNDPSLGTFLALKHLSGSSASAVVQRVGGSWRTKWQERVP